MFAFFNRLYVKVYLTIVATLFLVVAVSAMVWRFGPEADVARRAFEMAGAVAIASLPDPGAPAAEQQKAVERLARILETDLALYDAEDRLVAASRGAWPSSREVRDHGRRWFSRAYRGVWSLRLPDDRFVLVRVPDGLEGGGIGFLGHIAIVALLLGVGAYPVVRGLTRRLERLQQGVELLGAGDLSSRVKVEGKDEVARVAESFNRAAGRIEELVAAHRLLLANASHELRTPLTRLRMSIELLKEKADPQRKAELEQDIAELDQLIDEILLSSRLDAMQKLDAVEEIDLLALSAEEAARFDSVVVSGEGATTRGDPRLMRRLLRNLIENALRHGKPPVEVEIQTVRDRVGLAVYDRGPGVADEDRARIFEPFYRATVAGEKRPGAGLGLALVRQITQRHGGEVAPVREQDGRTGFVVTLPKAE